MPMTIPDIFAPKKTPQGIWAEYSKAKNFNWSIDLYEQVKRNERFMSGDQWNGVKAPDIDKPVLNFLNRTVAYQVALIISNSIGVSVTKAREDETEEGQTIAQYIQKQIEDVIEDQNFMAMNRKAIRDCAVDGDCCIYSYWDAEKNKIACEPIANTSVLFGNPVVSHVQSQPWIILEQQKDLREVQLQAYNAGLDYTAIQPDENVPWRESDTPYNSLETVTVVKKFWKDLETGHIWFCECTQNMMLHEPVDTLLTLYPIAWMNWEEVKENYHGKAIITGAIPNQIAVNRLWAGAIYHLRQLAFPKVFYDKNRIPHWSNMPGQAMGVVGGLTDVPATSFEMPKMDQDVSEVVEKTISMTRDFLGVNDVVLGNINPSNTSAIIAVQKSTAAPLEIQRLAYYQFVEDVCRVWVDLMCQNYGLRTTKVTRQVQDPYTGQMTEQDALFEIDFNAIDYDSLKIRVDIGEASYWSEIMQTQTMDNLFAKGLIPDASTYIKSIPDRYLPNKNEILTSLERAMGMQQGNQANVTDAQDVTEPVLSGSERMYDTKEREVDEAMSVM